MERWLEPVDLEGRFVRLEAMRPEHYEPLRATVGDDALWRYFPYHCGESYEAFFESSLNVHDSGKETVFVVRRLADNRVVGCSRFLNGRAGS